LRERSSGIFLGLCRIKGSGEGYNFELYDSHIWLNAYKLIE
jgi:hypothetical protein